MLKLWLNKYVYKYVWILGFGRFDKNQGVRKFTSSYNHIWCWFGEQAFREQMLKEISEDWDDSDKL